MCRLIVASGRFDAPAILAAAVAMSTGRTANDHDGKSKVHPNGWGAVWRTADGGLGVHRDQRAIADSLDAFPHPGLRTGFLAVHVRHATLERNLGPEFTHPLHRDGEPPWYFMHNGFLPTVHQCLGLPESAFDSRHYFDYVIPTGSRELDEAETMDRLSRIPSGGNSGNAVAVTGSDAYVIHWSPPDTPSPIFFAMHTLTTDDSFVISSEVVGDLAPPSRWEPLKPNSLVRLPLQSPSR